MVDPGTELSLLILDPEQQKNMPADVPRCIRAEILWVHRSQQIFGVKYLE
jgi:hypothetical protein